MNSRFLPAAAAILAALLGLAAASYLLAPDPAQLRSGTLLPAPRELPDFTLTDQDGKAFTRDSFKGHWSLVFPGFTHCPDVCPTTLAFLKALHADLARQQRPLQVTFVSVDPERDRPEQLANYVRYFHPTFTGITAAEPELSKFAQGLLITYVKVPGAKAEAYSMDHSAALVLINPQGQLAGFFTPPFQLEAMSADLVALIEPAS